MTTFDPNCCYRGCDNCETYKNPPPLDQQLSNKIIDEEE